MIDDMRILVTGASGFIGTNFINFFKKEFKCELLNLDISAPLDSLQSEYWQSVDIMDLDALIKAFSKFKPTHVVHMAARADCDENTTVEDGYSVNTIGTKNLLDAVKNCSSVERLIVVSTQYVCGPGRIPECDEDYFPHTVYGHSKVETEKLVRAANLKCIWTIVRPTNIWGPWHLRYRNEAWRVIKKGFYLHPNGQPVVRAYGYVGNVVRQMSKIFELDSALIDRETFYVGDKIGDIYNWVDAFSMALTGKHARKVSRGLLKTIGLFGDFVGIFGVKFPLTSSRFKSMTQDYLTNMDKTFSILGDSPVSVNKGVGETVEWLVKYDGK